MAVHPDPTATPPDLLGVTIGRWLREVDSETGPATAVHGRVRDLLVGIAHAAAPTLDRMELLDIVDETLLRSMVAVQSGVIDLTRPGAPGYVIVTVRRVARDRAARSRIIPADPADLMRVAEAARDGGPSPEAAFLALREHEDRVDVVAQAIGALRASGHSLTVRVVATWLDLADRRGEPPTLREVAAACAVSHTSVRSHLERMRAVLADLPGRPSGS